MAGRRYTREFKLEAVRLVRDRNLGMRQAAQDLDIHESVLRGWLKDYNDGPTHAFPGHGYQKPEQAEVAALKREIIKLKAEKVYVILSDAKAKRDGFLRIVDDSGEDYLYPEFYFVPLDLPSKAKTALGAAF